MAVKRTIRFENIDGEEVVEDWYFLLDETDALDMELAHRADLQEYLVEIQKNKDGRELLKVVKELLLASAGKRVDNLFLKDEATRNEFRYGGAYRQLFSEILESPDAGASFFTEIMPKRVQEKAAEEMNRNYSTDELLNMSDEEFAKVAGADERSMSHEHLLIAYRRKSSKAA